MARVYVWGDVDILCRRFIFVEEIDGDFGVVELGFLRSEGVDPIQNTEAMAHALLLSGVEAFDNNNDPNGELVRRLRRPVRAIHWNVLPLDYTISTLGIC